MYPELREDLKAGEWRGITLLSFRTPALPPRFYLGALIIFFEMRASWGHVQANMIFLILGFWATDSVA